MESDAISHSAAISACEKGAMWQHTLVLRGRRDNVAVECDAISDSAAISDREKGGMWQHALVLLDILDEVAGSAALGDIRV